MTEKIGVALDLMRLEGICKMLISTLEEDELESKYLFVTGQNKVDNVKKSLYKLTKSDLRKIISASPLITEEIIINFYNEYRYGRKPGFVLYWANGFIGKSIVIDDLKNRLAEFLSTKYYNDDARFKDLKCIAVDEWHENESSVFEVGLTYLKKYSFITADNNFDYIHELADCFAWINVEKGFVALYNMPPTVEGIMREGIHRLYGVKLLGLSLDRTMLDTIFDPARRKKVSLTNYDGTSDKIQKVTFSDPNFAEKQDATLAAYGEYDVASSLYNEGIDDETIATMGVNSNRGKLYLNKNVTTTQFRRWSVYRILTIIAYYAEIFSTDGWEKFQHIQLFSTGEWGRLTAEKRSVLSTISKAILACKEKGLAQYPIELSTTSLLSIFPRDTFYSCLAICDQCNETTIPSCVDCQNSVFEINAQTELVCSSCRKTVNNFQCECGVISPVENVESLLAVMIKDSLLSKIISELHTVVPSITLAENEYVVIHNGYLKTQNATNFKRLQPKDITSFHDLYNFELTSEMVSKAKQLYSRIGEKCSVHPTTEVCEQCKYKEVASLNDVLCIQQIFCFFDDFIPKPHQGHEFGDLSIQVSLDGRNLNMQGIMKSDTKKITRSSNTGREIIDQAIKGMLDIRTEVICIIAPTIFDDQLKETLLTLAKQFNKKILYWDFDFMARLAIAFEKTKNKTDVVS